MKDKFPGWNPPSAEQLEELWADALIAVDANVLLNAYRYSRSTRDDLLKALEGLGERLRLPHRAAEEFHRNRMKVLLEQRICREQLDRVLSKAQDELIGDLDETLRDHGRRERDSVADAVTKHLTALEKEVGRIDKEHHKGLGDKEDHRDDPLYQRIVKIIGTSVGPPFDDERLEAVIADSERRFAEAIPPAIGDEEKEEGRRHGDVIVWHQLIELAREEGQPVIFVTDDQKDWMWEIKGRLIGPRPELVAEMAAAAEQPFHVYSTASLVSHASAGGSDVDRDVLEELEAEAPAQRPLEWRIEPASGWIDQVVQGTADSSFGIYAGSSQSSAHSVIEPNGEVHVKLMCREARLANVVITCQVATPFGEVNSLSFHPRTGGRPASFVLTGFYPQEFGADPVVPGERYQVRWFTGSRREPDLIASDSFTL